ncbi:glycoside hydrolase family 3 N-terminal domain-containing protein [Campylobacter sp. MG1]|uniref:glycoside hydrolase family 3 N-terminal domain-containing protein n=1 Tax=Campylobacter sp. MG1 TaxID=2976332 RepID=UPI00226CD5B5|nr:glycoside hydrolase family 3 N-terminal domain-containing protein [Campylobacter sp. MG1]
MKKILIILFINIVLYSQNLSNISTQRLAGQMIMIGFNGKDIKEYNIRKLGQEASLGKVGGIVFSANNFTNIEQAKKLVSRFKNIAIVNPLFLGIDYSDMNSSNFSDFYIPNFVDFNKNLNDIRTDYFDIAFGINELGINLNLTLNVNSSKEFNKMSIYAREYADIFRKNNLLVSIKSFPGDMNAKDGVIGDYNFKNLRPFYDFIQTNKADMIMVSNKIYPILDKKPANMSKKIINMLKNDLSFNGVIVSDDILGGDLDGIDFKDRIIDSINAGVDILYFGLSRIKYGDTASYVVDIISQAVDDGKISRSRLEESYIKITSLKERI